MKTHFRLFVALAMLAAGCGDSADQDADDAADAGGEQGGAEQGGASEGGAPAVGPCDGFASEVVSVRYGPGAGFGQDAMPAIVLGAPQGTGELSGSLDVLALGNGGSITLGFGQQTIVDEAGPDFIVFENAFYAGGDRTVPFAELGTVEVSADGETWLGYRCVAVEAPYGTCAGWRPVHASALDPSVDPHDPIEAGGDAFDLADLGLTSARFVRITDRSDQTGLSGSFDLDAIGLVHWTCPAP